VHTGDDVEEHPQLLGTLEEAPPRRSLDWRSRYRSIVPGVSLCRADTGIYSGARYRRRPRHLVGICTMPEYWCRRTVFRTMTCTPLRFRPSMDESRMAGGNCPTISHGGALGPARESMHCRLPSEPYFSWSLVSFLPGMRQYQNGGVLASSYAIFLGRVSFGRAHSVWLRLSVVVLLIVSALPPVRHAPLWLIPAPFSAFG